MNLKLIKLTEIKNRLSADDWPYLSPTIKENRADIALLIECLESAIVNLEDIRTHLSRSGTPSIEAIIAGMALAKISQKLGGS